MGNLMAQGMRYANQVFILHSFHFYSFLFSFVHSSASPDKIYCTRPFFLDVLLVVFLPYFTVMNSVDCFHQIPESNAWLMLECFLTRMFSK
jgi:hypothetical protein